LPRLRKCRALPHAATVALVAPAFAVDGERVKRGAERLREAGLRVQHREDLLATEGFLAGDDARRARELMAAVEDERVDAILCVRGGWGCHRIVPLLDAGKVRAAGKPLVGFSDVTTLLLWQRRCAGLVGFHGPMLDRGAELQDDELAALVEALAGAGPLPVVRHGHEGGGGRPVEGRLVGGSLTLVAASLGTPWEIDTRGAILLLEDVSERPYRLDRMLEQLRHAGKLGRAAGIGLGRFVRCDEPGGGVTAAEVLREAVETAGVPWVDGLPFGHGAPNLPWPVGVRARLDAGRAELHILEPGVVRSR
jgi:muramoyltetrapeptide carboxypeptidase